MGFIRDQEVEVIIPNAIVLADDAVVNPMPVTSRGIDAEEKNCVVEEKTLDIAGILGISLEGTIRRFVHAFEGCLLRSLAVKKTVNSKVRKN